MPGGMPRGRADAVGEAVARFSDPESAQKAVSRLIASDVPARDIAIVGVGLRSIERITGRLGYATAARSGAINGLLLGLFFSAILVLGSPLPIQAFVGVLFVGIAFGMLLSIITYSFVRRRRDFASVVQVVADHYDVTVAASSIHRARQVLGGGAPAPSPAVPTPPTAPAAAAEPVRAPAAPVHAEPPRYGERVVPAAAPSADPGARDAGADSPDASADAATASGDASSADAPSEEAGPDEAPGAPAPGDDERPAS